MNDSEHFQGAEVRQEERKISVLRISKHAGKELIFEQSLLVGLYFSKAVLMLQCKRPITADFLLVASQLRRHFFGRDSRDDIGSMQRCGLIWEVDIAEIVEVLSIVATKDQETSSYDQ